MTTYVPPKINTAHILYTALVSQADTKLLKKNPTIAAGDFVISIDGGTFTTLATLPVVTPGNATSTSVKISLSAAEMNGDNIAVQVVDAAGAEWCDQYISLQTAARQVDDLAFPATSGRSFVVDASGVVNSNVTTFGGVAGTFSSGRPEVNTTSVNGDATSAANLAKTTRAIARGTVGSASTTTSVITSAFTPAGIATDQFKGRIITFDADTTTTALRGQATDITGSTISATPVFTVTALTTAPASTDTFSVT